MRGSSAHASSTEVLASAESTRVLKKKEEIIIKKSVCTKQRLAITSVRELCCLTTNDLKNLVDFAKSRRCSSSLAYRS